MRILACMISSLVTGQSFSFEPRPSNSRSFGLASARRSLCPDNCADGKRVTSACVASQPKNSGLGQPISQYSIQKFLLYQGATDTAEPIGDVSSFAVGEFAREHDLGEDHATARSQNPGNLAHDRVFIRRQVENSIGGYQVH